MDGSKFKDTEKQHRSLQLPRFYQPDGQPVKVLNDLLSTHSYSRNAKAVDTIHEGEVAPLFRFQPSSPVPPDKKKANPSGVG